MKVCRPCEKDLPGMEEIKSSKLDMTGRIIQNVKILKADWKIDADSLGLQLTIRAKGNQWTSVIDFPLDVGLRVLKGYGVMNTQELVGKWCTVAMDDMGLCSNSVYIGPFSHEDTNISHKPHTEHPDASESKL